ncbi:MAG: hypothetical protein ACXVC3_20175, partial [Bdellovibrio sp.]
DLTAGGFTVRNLKATLKYFAILFILSVLVSPLNSFAKGKTAAAKGGSCFKLGQGETLSGEPSGDEKHGSPCCRPLKDREPKDICGIPTGGSYQYVCIACGDGKCDPEYENTCNCHEDCK